MAKTGVEIQQRKQQRKGHERKRKETKEGITERLQLEERVAIADI